ncbi:hypothetical protein C8Q74DRAFT_1029146 [Fomes fomentarius]|nr:hypothetical protein C8Q74DRAFT_1029146 [Fomes fomentarius]
MYHTHVGDEFCFPIIHYTFREVSTTSSLSFPLISWNSRLFDFTFGMSCIPLPGYSSISRPFISHSPPPPRLAHGPHSFTDPPARRACLAAASVPPSVRLFPSDSLSSSPSLPCSCRPSGPVQHTYRAYLPHMYISLCLPSLISLHVGYFRRLVFNDPNDYLLLSYAVLSSHRSC